MHTKPQIEHIICLTLINVIKYCIKYGELGGLYGVVADIYKYMSATTPQSPPSSPYLNICLQQPAKPSKLTILMHYLITFISVRQIMCSI